MFDSLGGGYIPICLIMIASAWHLSKLKDIKLRVLMTVIVPIAVSLAWYFIPDFFRSNPDRQDSSWVTWGLIAATAWSIAAIPTSIISVYVFSIIRKKAELKTKTTTE